MSNDQIPILIIDDGERRIACLSRLVEDDLALTEAETLTDRELAELTGAAAGFEAVVFDSECRNNTGAGVITSIMSPNDDARVPLILLTGTEIPSLPERIVREATYTLRKPVDERTLCAVIRAAVIDRDERSALRKEVRSRKSAVGQIVSGEFQIRTLEEAENLATMLSLACPESERLALGARELFINAIEHGNLGIGFEEKSSLLASDSWQCEISRRLQQAPYRDRYVRVRFSYDGRTARLRIDDQGKGFDFRRYSNQDAESAKGMHGRGLLFAREMAFDEVRFLGNGSSVEACLTISNDHVEMAGVAEED